MQLADDTKLKFLSYGPLLLQWSLVTVMHAPALAKLSAFTPRARLDFSLRTASRAGRSSRFRRRAGRRALAALGIAVRVTAALLIPVMIGALLVHLPNGWMFIAPNGGWECLAFLIGALLTQVLIGGGTLALGTHRQNAA